mmetsp:Transcript_23603/g.23285  ORF Transcript_23603/g.23285 Transcript_23603/m.23285 type:complete len:127 (-) Transcript_23603:29-409(-)
MSSNLVPWEVQSINTCTDNFLWEKSKSSVVTVAPGLYELSLGFYSKKTPVAIVYVNGEAVLTLNNSKQSTGTMGKENKVSNVGKHSQGNITGLTLMDFVALPARARISVTYQNEGVGEGFISLRKI